MTTQTAQPPQVEQGLVSESDVRLVAKEALSLARGMFGLGEGEYPLLADLSHEAYVSCLEAIDGVDVEGLDFGSCFVHAAGVPSIAAFGAEAATIFEEALHPGKRSPKRSEQKANRETTVCDLAVPVFVQSLMEGCFGLERSLDSAGPPPALYCWPVENCADQLAGRICKSWPGSERPAKIRIRRRIQKWHLDEELREAIDDAFSTIRSCSTVNRSHRRGLRIAARRLLRRHRRRNTIPLLSRMPRQLARDWSDAVEREGWPPAWPPLHKVGYRATNPSRVRARLERFRSTLRWLAERRRRSVTGAVRRFAASKKHGADPVRRR